MLPATRMLADYLKSQSPEPEMYEEPASHMDRFDPKVLELQVKKRRQLQMIKQMLENAGYTDLAAMTNLRRSSLDTEE